MVRPVRYRNQLEIHDEAVKAFISQLKIHDPDLVQGSSSDIAFPVVYATPERAFAEMRTLLQQNTTFEVADRVKQAPLPFASFYRNPPLRVDPQRHNRGVFSTWLGYVGDPIPVTQQIGTGDGSTELFSGTLGGSKFVPSSIMVTAGLVTGTDNGSGVISDTGTALTGTINYTSGSISLSFSSAPAVGTAVLVVYNHKAHDLAYTGRFPYPFDFDYTVDFWTRHRETQNEIVENFVVGNIATRFNPFEAFLCADFGPPWGPKLIPIDSWSWIDNSDLEPGETDRVLRLTLSFTAKGWLFLNEGTTPKKTYTVQEIVTEYFLQDPGSGYDPLTGTVELLSPTPPPDETVTILPEEE